MPDEEVRDAPLEQVMFMEFFAGDARLTRLFEEAGIKCRKPDDLATGGMDFESAAQVRTVREELRNLRTDDDVLPHDPLGPAVFYLF